MFKFNRLNENGFLVGTGLLENKNAQKVIKEH
jgi:indole-3-glycerol phosphate synthase